MTQLESAVDRPQRPVLMANPNFMIIWLGQLVSQLGTAFFNFAMVIWIVQTAGAPALAGIMMVASIPGILLGPVAGTLVDRINRKAIIVFSDLFLGGTMFVAAWLLQQQSFQLVHIYALLIIVNAIQPLFSSAVSAALPNLVDSDQLARANSLRQAAVSGTNLVGPALAAILLAALGGVEKAIILYFLINGLSFIVSGVSEMFLRIPAVKRVKEATNGEALRAFGRQLVEGLKYVWRSNLISRLMVILAAMNFFLAPLSQVVVPGVVIDVLALDEMWLGFIQSGIAGGFLLSSVILSIVRQTRLSRLVIMGVMAMGLSVFLLGLVMALPMYTTISLAMIASSMVLFAVMLGASAAVGNIALSTIMQKVVPDERRGRVFAFMNTFIGGLMPVSLGVAGLLAALAPLFVQPVIGGVAVVGAGLMLRRVKEFRKY